MTNPLLEPRNSAASTRSVLLILALWLAALAVAVGAGIPQKLTPPAPQAVLLALTAALLIATRFYAPLNAWIQAIDWRSLVGLHVFRAVPGAGFLLAAARGTLLLQFARMAGYGDILVGVLALGLIVRGSRGSRESPGLLLAWNTLGFLDIAIVVISAARNAIANPASMSALMRVPFVVLPLFYVPLVIASHVVLFSRVSRQISSET